MKFWKIVAAYLTGWLIVQPLYNRLINYKREQEARNPSEETTLFFKQQARAIVDEMDARIEARRAEAAAAVDTQLRTRLRATVREH